MKTSPVDSKAFTSSLALNFFDVQLKRRSKMRPETPCETQKDVSFTWRGVPPKMARSNFCSGVVAESFCG